MAIDFTIIHLTETDSTQDEALRHMRSGASNGTVIIADHQTKGRGRQGRAWESLGGNLLATMILHLEKTDKPGDISLLIGVVIAEVLATKMGNHADVTLKWPNDVLLNGFKCVGILIERPEPDVLLIGFGVNLRDAPPDRACLAHVMTPPLPRDVLDAILAHFQEWIALYRTNGITPIRDAWLKRAHGLHQPLTARLPREEISGIFDGLDENGALILKLPDGTVRLINSGEVFFDAP
jgi:BirA family transcriptional regulator, biotin operon repressor / biotin---[acetyl-CoA-carboxylase] ligase